MRFTFVAYKPDSDDYCRGCHMASYSSDMVFGTDLSAECLLKLWTECLVKNEKLSISEAGYDFSVSSGDVLLFDGNYCVGSPDTDDSSEFTAAWAVMNTVHEQATALAKGQIAREQADAKVASAAAKARQDMIDKATRHATFLQLKSEFEPAVDNRLK